MFDFDDGFDPALAELEELSNGVIGLINAGRFDEAERDCLELRRRFPNEIDWLERTAAVAVVKGQNARAIEHYKRCIEFVDRNPDEWDMEIREAFQFHIDMLEAEAGRSSGN